MPEFEREMRRRVWCVLNTWDWQISALLSRPVLINRAECDVQLPSLSLEAYSPSPHLHMKLQSQLIEKLADKFVLPKYVVEPADVREYARMMEDWMKNLPPTYDMNNPERSQDEQHPWIKLHRHYLHTMACSMTLDPIRAYLSTEKSIKSSPDVLDVRNIGVDYALRLMKILHGFFDHLWPRDAKFHFALFAIFDTASVLCSSIIHDLDNKIPREEEILAAIENALSMLRRLQELLPSAKLTYDLLLKFWKKARKLSSRGRSNVTSAASHGKRRKMVDILPKAASTAYSTGYSSTSTEPIARIEHGFAVPSNMSPAYSGAPSFHSYSTEPSSMNRDGQLSIHPPLYGSTFNADGLTRGPFMEDHHIANGYINSHLPPTGDSSLGALGPLEAQQNISAMIPSASKTFPGETSGSEIWPEYQLDGNPADFGMPQYQLNEPTAGTSYEHFGNHIIPQTTGFGLDTLSSGVYLDGSDGTDLGLATLMENEASDLAHLWNWKSLDLDFMPPPNEDIRNLEASDISS
jgi:hypothetical protein